MTVDSTQEHRVWLADTLTRVALRYSRALHALSMVPGPLALARLWDLPEARDVQEAAATIAKTVDAAIDELARLAEYVDAIADPGQGVCAECGANVNIFQGDEDFEHWRWVPDENAVLSGQRRETYDAGHAVRPLWPNPPRPNWRSEDTDLSPDSTAIPDHAR